MMNIYNRRLLRRFICVVIFICLLLAFIQKPIRVIEFLFRFADWRDPQADLEMEKIMTNRRLHLQEMCRREGRSVNDPVPPNEDNEKGQLYLLPQFESFVCM